MMTKMMEESNKLSENAPPPAATRASINISMDAPLILIPEDIGCK